MIDERWTSFKIVADIKAPPREIYDAWTIPTNIEKWFLRKAQIFSIAGRERAETEALKRDDTYTWHRHGFNEDNGIEKGAILDANGSNFIKFTYAGKCVVSVSITSQKGLSIVELKQDNIPPESDPTQNLYVTRQLDWQLYLLNLKSVMEGGIDLRNKRPDVESSFK